MNAKDDVKVDPTKWTEVYSTRPGDYYADTISVSDKGAVKMESGGRTIIKDSVRLWVLDAWDPLDIARPK